MHFTHFQQLIVNYNEFKCVNEFKSPPFSKQQSACHHLWVSCSSLLLGNRQKAARPAGSRKHLNTTRSTMIQENRRKNLARRKVDLMRPETKLNICQFHWNTIKSQINKGSVKLEMRLFVTSWRWRVSNLLLMWMDFFGCIKKNIL